MNPSLNAGVGRSLNSLSLLKSLALTISLTALSLTSKAQVDTIYSNNIKIACTVKEITPDAVKYTYPGEDLLNSVYKSTAKRRE
jgi:hypothetical protein